MFDISKLIEIEIKPALGVTEPVAVGYATSLAYNAILGRVPAWLKGKIPIGYVTDIQQEDIQINTIEVAVDRGTFKNALAVGIPRSGGQKGMIIAAAMGVFCFPEAEGKEMTLFETLQPQDLSKAKTLAEKVKVRLIEGWEEGEDIEIKASIEAKHKRLPTRTIRGTASIEKGHSNVTSITVSDSLGRVREFPSERKPESYKNNDSVKDRLKRMKISEIVTAVETLPSDVMEKMIEMMEMNIAISEEGLKGTKGLGIGAKLNNLVKEGYLGDDLTSSAQIMVASAADARMGGANYPVMSCAGSGNHGIACSLPIIAVAQKNGYDVKRLLDKRRSGQISKGDEKKLNKLVKALALSALVTCYVTYHTNYLSAFCGCAVKAGLGATAGIAYFLTQSSDKVEMAIQNMAGNIPGLICDGAKDGCSLKLTTSASVAIQSALLATKGIQVAADNGIVAEKVEDTIQNIGRISQAMVNTDTMIVSIMVDKSR